MLGRPGTVARRAVALAGAATGRRRLAAVALWVAAAGLVVAAPATALPTAELTVKPNPAEPGETVRLDATGSTGNNSIDGCEFDPDGDGQFELFEDDCVGNWTYNETATYNVTVRVFEGDRTDLASRLLAVSEPPTVELGYAPTRPSTGEQVSFEANASDPDGQVTGYVWYVDGVFASESAGATFERTFQDAGRHTVTVVVTDDAGHEVSRTVNVSVQSTPTPTATRTPTPTPTPPPDGANQPPTVDLGAETTTPAVGDPVDFEAAASDPDGQVVALTWSVDGTEVGSGATLTWTFDAAGAHEVVVAATDDDGATTRERVTVQVSAPAPDTPTRTATPSPLPGLVPLVGGGLALLVLAGGAAKLLGGGGSAAGAGGAATSGGPGSGGEGGRSDLEEEARDELEEQARKEARDRLDDDRDRDDEETIVYLRADGFDPVRTEVDPGTTVRWINVDDEPHAVDPVATVDDAAEWTLEDAALDPSTMTERQFDERGVYEFRCPDCGKDDAGGAVVVGDAELPEGALPCEDGE